VALSQGVHVHVSDPDVLLLICCLVAGSVTQAV